MSTNRYAGGYDRFEVNEIGSGAVENIFLLKKSFDGSKDNRVDGKINAKFDRTVHISLPKSTSSNQKSWLVLGSEDVREGPLLMQVSTPFGFSFKEQIAPENENVVVRLYNTRSTLQLTLEGGLTFLIDLNQLPMLPAAGGIYKKFNIEEFQSGSNLVTMNKALIEYLEEQSLEDGLGLLTELDQLSSRESFYSIQQLLNSFHTILSESNFDQCVNPDKHTVLFQPIKELIGRGPGATPSGDDILIGIFLILQRVSDEHISKAAQELCEEVSEKANFMSTQISSSLLSQVVKNRAAEPAKSCARVMTDVTSDKADIITAADDLIKTGHTSGIDCLTGMLIATTLILPNLNKEDSYKM